MVRGGKSGSTGEGRSGLDSFSFKIFPLRFFLFKVFLRDLAAFGAFFFFLLFHSLSLVRACLRPEGACSDTLEAGLRPKRSHTLGAGLREEGCGLTLFF